MQAPSPLPRICGDGRHRNGPIRWVLISGLVFPDPGRALGQFAGRQARARRRSFAAQLRIVVDAVREAFEIILREI